jgi:hypothetical protein
VVLLPDGVRNYMTKFLDDNWLADRDIIQIQASTIKNIQHQAYQKYTAPGVGCPWEKERVVFGSAGLNSVFAGRRLLPLGERKGILW